MVQVGGLLREGLDAGQVAAAASDLLIEQAHTHTHTHTHTRTHTLTYTRARRMSGT